MRLSRARLKARAAQLYIESAIEDLKRAYGLVKELGADDAAEKMREAVRLLVEACMSLSREVSKGDR